MLILDSEVCNFYPADFCANEFSQLTGWLATRLPGTQDQRAYFTSWRLKGFSDQIDEQWRNASIFTYDERKNPSKIQTRLAFKTRLTCQPLSEGEAKAYKVATMQRLLKTNLI